MSCRTQYCFGGTLASVCATFESLTLTHAGVASLFGFIIMMGIWLVFALVDSLSMPRALVVISSKSTFACATLSGFTGYIRLTH